MNFKKQLSKKIKDEELMNEYKIWSSKSVFLIAAFSFFLNIFLVGSDKSNSYPFLKTLLPLTYTFFIAALLFLSLAAIDKILVGSFVKYKKIVRYVVVAFFILPLLVFFIQPELLVST